MKKADDGLACRLLPFYPEEKVFFARDKHTVPALEHSLETILYVIKRQNQTPLLYKMNDEAFTLFDEIIDKINEAKVAAMFKDKHLKYI
jgi:hypothetical protein